MVEYTSSSPRSLTMGTSTSRRPASLPTSFIPSACIVFSSGSFHRSLQMNLFLSSSETRCITTSGWVTAVSRSPPAHSRRGPTRSSSKDPSAGENVRMAMGPPAAANQASLLSYSLAPRRSRILVMLPSGFIRTSGRRSMFPERNTTPCLMPRTVVATSRKLLAMANAPRCFFRNEPARVRVSSLHRHAGDYGLQKHTLCFGPEPAFVGREERVAVRSLVSLPSPRGAETSTLGGGEERTADRGQGGRGPRRRGGETAAEVRALTFPRRRGHRRDDAPGPAKQQRALFRFWHRGRVPLRRQTRLAVLDLSLFRAAT
mmetsp:Transcript_8138/g.22048  ORF Transcript_8138/g.22048 Transcript_8138/m.22048 type:complete len:316 (+) Transcript_8138:1633-2580(+)